MNDIASRIKALIATAGPLKKEEMVFVGAKGKDNYQELGKFWFRRLSFPEVDAMRLASVDETGTFSKTLHAGSNARKVAATLIDENTGINCYTVDDVNAWPAEMVDAFAAASDRANALTVSSAKAVIKNSETTVGATS